LDEDGNGPIAPGVILSSGVGDTNGTDPGGQHDLGLPHELRTDGAFDPAAAGVMCSNLTGTDSTRFVIAFSFRQRVGQYPWRV
jgi:hypothetical protein